MTTNYTKGTKVNYIKWKLNIRNGHKIFEMATKHYKTYPNWDFWYENMPYAS
jgi:hypothetical protein